MTDDELIEILNHNKGFDNPAKWITYARRKNFRKVDAVQLAACPDCGCDKSRVFGQYVHFSQLVRARECHSCGLIFSDVHINDEVTKAHFEAAYKDEEYFTNDRRPVFDQVLKLILKKYRDRNRIVDIGGATGMLASRIKSALPENEIFVCDVSSKACEDVQSKFNIQTINCSVSEIDNTGREFDLLLLIDVLYYAKDIADAWESLGATASKSAALVLRIPNRLWWMRIVQCFRRALGSRLSDRMHGFNREHYFIFTRKYIEKRLSLLGFKSIRFHSAAMSVPRTRWLVPIARATHAVSRLAEILTRGSVILTSSMLVVAEKE